MAANPRPARAPLRPKAPSAPGERRPSSFARLRVLSAVLPLVVLAIALAVSYAVWERERREIERVLKEDFDQRVNDAVNVFRERVQGYEQVLRAVSGLFASSRKDSASKARSNVCWSMARTGTADASATFAGTESPP